MGGYGGSTGDNPGPYDPNQNQRKPATSYSVSPRGGTGVPESPYSVDVLDFGDKQVVSGLPGFNQGLRNLMSNIFTSVLADSAQRAGGGAIARGPGASGPNLQDENSIFRGFMPQTLDSLGMFASPWGGAPTYPSGGGGSVPPAGPGMPPGGGGGQSPLGPPVAGGPYQGQPMGSPIPTPGGFDQYGPGPIDETGNRFPEPATDPRMDPGSIVNQFSRWARTLGGKASGKDFWQQPFSASPDLSNAFAALMGTSAGADAPVNGGPSLGMATSLLGDFLTMSPRLRELNLSSDQALSGAEQLWSQLPGEAQRKLALSMASIYGGGGTNPTLQAFFKNKFVPGMLGGGPTTDPNRLSRADQISQQQHSPENAAMFDRIRARRGGASPMAAGYDDVGPSPLAAALPMIASALGSAASLKSLLSGGQQPQAQMAPDNSMPYMPTFSDGGNSLANFMQLLQMFSGPQSTAGPSPLSGGYDLAGIPGRTPQAMPDVGRQLGDAGIPGRTPQMMPSNKTPGAFHTQRLKRLGRSPGGLPAAPSMPFQGPRMPVDGPTGFVPGPLGQPIEGPGGPGPRPAPGGAPVPWQGTLPISLAPQAGPGGMGGGGVRWGGPPMGGGAGLPPAGGEVFAGGSPTFNEQTGTYAPQSGGPVAYGGQMPSNQAQPGMGGPGAGGIPNGIPGIDNTIFSEILKNFSLPSYGGATYAGSTPLQRQATDFAGRAMSADPFGSQAQAQQTLSQMLTTGLPFDNTQQFDALAALGDRRMAQSEAAINENMSMGGLRFGSDAAQGVGQMRGEYLAQESLNRAQMAQQSYESAMARRMGALPLGGQMAGQNIQNAAQAFNMGEADRLAYERAIGRNMSEWARTQGALFPLLLQFAMGGVEGDNIILEPEE